MFHARSAFRLLPAAIFAVVALLACGAAADAQTVTIGWDANAESDLAGYRVEYGTQAGNPTTTVDVGNVVTRQFSGLQFGVTYYFRVRAYNASGQVSGPSNEIWYTPQAPSTPPSVTSVSPASGPTAGGTVITVTGNALVAGAVVRVNGVLATNLSWLSSTQLRATTPAGSAGARSVQVTNPDGQQATLANAFTYTNPAPAVTSVSPNSGPIAGGTVITVTGTNFLSGATVAVNGVSATAVSLLSATQIRATTPAGSAGARSVRVTHADGQSATLANAFTYLAPAPTVTSVSPASGPTAGGTVITVTGTGFVSGAVVAVDGVSASAISLLSATQLRATTPAGNAGARSVRVTNPDGQSATRTSAFTYTSPVPAPVLTSVSPASGPAAGGTVITLAGANFVSGATVRVNGAAATGVTFVSASQLRATTPPGPAGARSVQVSNPDGQSATLGTGFTYVNAAPALTAVSPNAGPTAGGTVITITGANFLSGAVVSVNLVPATGVTLVSATQLRATTPAGVPGTHGVRVTNPDGQAATLAAAFTYGNAAPTLTAVSPPSGPVEGGTAVTLSGTNFLPGATVRVGGAAATGVVVVSGTTITAVTPAGSAGAQAVQVSGPDGQAASLASAFTYTRSSTEDDDGDGLPSAWERQYGLDPASAVGVNGAAGDPDADGLDNLAEYQANSHPRGMHKRYLAEGVVNAFFSTRLAIANPQAAEAKVLLTFVDARGATTREYVAVAPRARRTLDARSIAALDGASFSTTLESDELVVLDRLMQWGQGGYSAHAETALERPSTTWYLAEGATHGQFELFYLLQNPSAAAADVQIRYLRPSGEPLTKHYAVPAGSRFTIWVDQEDRLLAATDVSAEITSTNGVPIIVERSMYLNTPRRAFKGGHNSAGVNAPATSWFLAEGSTGGFFSMFILLANPGAQAATVQATYLLASGAPVVKTYTVAANSRRTVNVAAEDRRLADASMSVKVEATNGVPVIVERTMWWPGANRGWTEGHNAFGTTTTGPRWLLAEGEQGGAQSIMSFVLVANTSAEAASVKVTMLFESGPEQSLIYSVAANSRFTVPIDAAFPAARERRFSVLVESLNPAAAGSLVVERAMYWNTDEDFWGAGSNAAATRLP